MEEGRREEGEEGRKGGKGEGGEGEEKKVFFSEKTSASITNRHTGLEQYLEQSLLQSCRLHQLHLVEWLLIEP